jgi:hypothetical protein
MDWERTRETGERGRQGGNIRQLVLNKVLEKDKNIGCSNLKVI